MFVCFCITKFSLYNWVCYFAGSALPSSYILGRQTESTGSLKGITTDLSDQGTEGEKQRLTSLDQHDQEEEHTSELTRSSKSSSSPERVFDEEDAKGNKLYYISYIHIRNVPEFFF